MITGISIRTGDLVPHVFIYRGQRIAHYKAVSPASIRRAQRAQLKLMEVK